MEHGEGHLKKVLGEQRLQVAVERRDASRRRLAPMITMNRPREELWQPRQKAETRCRRLFSRWVHLGPQRIEAIDAIGQHALDRADRIVAGIDARRIAAFVDRFCGLDQ